MSGVEALRKAKDAGVTVKASGDNLALEAAVTNNVRAQDARFQQALVNYENTVLNTAKEVEDALIGFLKDQQRAAYLQRSVDAAQRSVELSIIQYGEGAENFQRVIDSQTRLLTEMNRVAETRSSIATNLIAVYKALAGC